MEALRKKERTARKKKLLLFFLTGFVLGVLYVVFLTKAESGSMLMSSYFFSKYQYMDFSSAALLAYILKSRLPVLAFLWLMGLTALGALMARLFGLWTGFSFGLLLTMAVEKLGMAGVLLCLISMFPHYLIYFPALFFGLLHVCEMSGSRRLTGAYAASFGIIAALIVGGALLESYVNPILLKSLLRSM